MTTPRAVPHRFGVALPSPLMAACERLPRETVTGNNSLRRRPHGCKLQPTCYPLRHEEVTGMAILHVRNVPDDLYARLQQRAAAEKRSLSAEVVMLLEKAMQREPAAEAALFDHLRRQREELERTVGR